MRVSVAIMLMAVFFVEPFSCQRLPRTRSRLSTTQAQIIAVEKAEAAEAAEALKKLKSKSEAKTFTEASNNTTSTSPSTHASPPSLSPSPSPLPSSPKPPTTPSTKEGGNATALQTTTTPLETTSTSVAPPVSSVQVRMAFSPSKKAPEERGASKSAFKDDDSKSDIKLNKSSDTQESTRETSKKLTTSQRSTSTSSPSTSTAKPKSPSTKKSDQDDELRDALKRIHQEVLKSSNPTTTKSPKDEKGLETAESTLDAQASIQSTKFIPREQGLQQLPSFVRGKDRSLATSPNTVRYQQPLVGQQHRQRSHPLTDSIDEEAITTSTSTTAYPHIPIVHFDKEQSADGSYKTSYETANNIFAEETGFLKNPGVENQEALVQQGSYSYTAPDGSLISVTYTADEMGFRAAGTHLPTPPPVPPEIQRSLDIIYAQIQRDEEEAAREAELERQGEASETETHGERLSPPTTGSKRESRRYLPKQGDEDQF